MVRSELLKRLTEQSELLDSVISLLQEPEVKPTQTDTPDYCTTLEQSKIEVLAEPLKLYKVVQRVRLPKPKDDIVCSKCNGFGYIEIPNTLVNKHIWCECQMPTLKYEIMELNVSIAVPDPSNNMKIYVVGNEWIPSTSIYDKYVPELYKQYENVYYTSKEQAEIHKGELGSA